MRRNLNDSIGKAAAMNRNRCTFDIYSNECQQNSSLLLSKLTLHSRSVESQHKKSLSSRILYLDYQCGMAYDTIHGQ